MQIVLNGALISGTSVNAGTGTKCARISDAAGQLVFTAEAPILPVPLRSRVPLRQIQ